jgi:endonuclease/exonuclease/phosphatase family metal-dependent hydrolase
VLAVGAALVLGGAEPTSGTAPAALTGAPWTSPQAAAEPGPASEPEAEPEPTATVTAWHWNVAGNTLHGGSVTDGLVDAVVASVLATGADLVSLNEVCEQQYEAVGARLRELGWPADPPASSAFRATLAGPDVCAGRPAGLAVFSAHPVGAVEAVALPHDGSREQRALLCVSARDPAGLRFCTTHVTTSGGASPVDGRPHNEAQLAAVLASVEAGHAAGDTVVVAGDLNAQPHYRRLDGWYAPGTAGSGGGRGSYRELDDTDPGCPGTGEWTATGPAGAPPPCGGGAPCTPADTRGCAKIDHLFVRQDRITGAYTADALDTPLTCTSVAGRPDLPAGACSDHRPLVGTVTVQVRR